MMSEWNLEWIWIIFIQGPLLILSGITNVFQTILGINVVEGFGANNNGFNIFIIYGPLVLIVMAISIGVVIYKAVQSKFEYEHGRREMLSAIKYLGINLILIFIIPVLIFAMTLFLTFISNELAKIFIPNGDGTLNDLANKLYWIGYHGELDPTVGDAYLNIKDFQPPSFSFNGVGLTPFLNSDWNYFIEIPAIFISLFLPLYICFTFIQKIIEIFVLSMFSPIGMINNLLDDGARFKWLLKNIFKKLLVVIWCVFAFFCFNLFSQLICNSLLTNKPANYGVIYLVSILAIVVSIYLSLIFIANKTDQKIGFIGLYKSTKQTLGYKKAFFNKNNNKLSDLESQQLQNQQSVKNQQVIQIIKATDATNTVVLRDKIKGVDVFN